MNIQKPLAVNCSGYIYTLNNMLYIYLKERLFDTFPQPYIPAFLVLRRGELNFSLENIYRFPFVAHGQ